MSRRGLVAGLALLIVWPAAPRAAGSAEGQWAIVASPNSGETRTNNFLTATTCAAADDCWAVGYYNRTVGTYQTLIEHWDGSAWTAVPSPNTAVTQSNVLRGVTCAAANDCWAVGSASEPGSPQRTLILHWDGTDWALVPSPNGGESDYNYLFGVACAAASDCWAVGYRNTAEGFQTLVLRWNGSAWSLAASPNAGGTQSFLEGVACAAAGDCWAVGWSVDPLTGFNRTLIQRWNGLAWSIVTSANALLSTHNDLHGVACADPADCWAIGAAHNGSAQQTLVQRWNGTSWAVVASPSSGPAEANVLRSVACASPVECVAVGSAAGSAQQTLALRWNGGQWTRLETPNVGTARDNTLFGAACADGCWAAGFHMDDAGIQQALLLRGQGELWTAGAAANRTAAQNNTLLGVDCVAADDCWAVASYFDGAAQRTLIEYWDGSGWTLRPSPNTGPGESNILYDVSCVSADDCWVIGYALGVAGWQTLALHWDGLLWAIVPSPSVAGGNNFLTDVHCVAADDCWAVGFHDTGVYQTLVLHWDGGAWGIVASPNTDAFSENRLSGIDCAAADDCWAVGLHKVDGFLQRTLALHWDGSAWSLVATPNTDAAQNNVLEDVACTAASSCWAVGAWSPGAPGTGQPLIQHWDGTTWSLAAAPQPSANANNYLRSVACVADGCWAVGDFFAEGQVRTLVLRGRDGVWDVAASPNTSPTQANRLVGVACPSAALCWSVGYYTDDAGIFHTLTQRYLAPLPAAPDPFTFLERVGVATAVVVTSEAQRVAGFAGTLAIRVEGGQYRIDAGPWTAAEGAIAAGARLSVRHVSSDEAGTATETRLTVGAYTTVLRSVTSSVDRTPDPFTFGSQTGVAPSVPVESTIVTLAGFNSGIPIAPGPGIAYRIDGGAWATGSGTLPPGQILQVRHTSSAASLGYVRTYVKIGGVTGYFTTRTR